VTITTRPFGSTGVGVTEIGLGGCFVRTTPGTEHDVAIQTIQHALDAGITHIDTAPFYGNSQAMIGEALNGRSDGFLLGSKCGRWPYETGPYRDLDAYKAQFEQTLKDLRRDAVDLLYIHEADWAVYWQEMPIPRPRCELAPDESVDYESAPALEFLRWAKEQGAARYLGISGNNAHLLAKILRECPMEMDAVLVAFQYSLLCRNAREYLLGPARERGVAAVLGAPLEQGRLSVPRPEMLDEPPRWLDDDLRERFRALYRIREESGLPLAELGLRFLLSDPDFSAVICGAADPTQVDQNVQCSLSGPLDPDLHQRLDALGRVFEGIWGTDY
jgi:aryl-alcohol dehydrogenase-like predicted oxidoreductase